MKRYILNQLIIVAGQWQQFGGKRYENQFESLLEKLQKETGLNREAAVDLLMLHIREKKVAA